MWARLGWRQGEDAPNDLPWSRERPKGNPKTFWIILLILIGLLTKMAVFPFHSWMPWVHAEHPTCIAGLLAVYANIAAYIMVRVLIMPLHEDFRVFSIPLMIMALLTMVYGSFLTMAQDDVKRFAACSTVSQISYSLFGIAALTTYSVEGGMFFFLSHIMGKTILFSTAGLLVYATHTRDIREMGGLFSKMKITGTTMFIAALALAGIGIPFIDIGTAGFFSKDMIIEKAFEFGEITGGLIGWIPYGFAVFAALLTSIYIFRLWFMTFAGKPRSERHPHESPGVMTRPLMVLAVFALLFGFVHLGFYSYLDRTYEEIMEPAHEGEEAHVPVIITLLPVIVGVLGFLISYAIYHKRMLDMSKLVSSQNPLYKLLLNRYYEPKLSADIIGVKLTHNVAAQSGEFVDRKIIDTLIIDNIIGNTLFKLGEVVRKLQTGIVQNYASVTLLGIGLLLVLLRIGGI